MTMTLVVARKSGDRIAIASDTLITQQDFPLPFQEGVIKSCMLPGGLCASFSNSPELAAADFADYSQKYPQGSSFGDATAHFEASSARTGNDYLLAFSRQLKLVKISNGQRRSSIASTQWIGDGFAYSRFREYETKLRRNREVGRAINAVLFADEMTGSPASDLYSVMRSVTADPDVKSTGGFVCVISGRQEHFRHSVYSDMLFNWPEADDDNFILSLEDPIDFGASGENANYAVAQISAGYLGVNAVAFYLLRGKKLFVFYEGELGLANRCVVLSDVAPEQIPDELAEKVHPNLNWLALITSSAQTKNKTLPRVLPRTSDANGVAFETYCHLNTFPPTKR